MFADDELVFNPWLGVGIDMPRGDRQKRKGLYQAVFDGSGTVGTHPGVVYAGAVSTQIQWAAFNEAWETLLVKHDLAYFKMAEAMTFYGEFAPKVKDWGSERDARRDALLLELATLKTRYDLRTTGCGLVVGADGGGPFSTKDHTLEKKKLLFQQAIIALLQGVPPHYNVMLLCDAEPDAESAYRNWISGLMRTDSEKVARIIGLGFFDDKYAQPIQFADMVAWVVRQEITRRLQDPDATPNALYQALLPGSNTTFEPIMANGQLSGIEMRI